MPLKFRCVCGQALIVSRSFVGRSVRCPKCDTKLRVPQPQSLKASTSVASAGESERPLRWAESDTTPSGTPNSSGAEFAAQPSAAVPQIPTSTAPTGEPSLPTGSERLESPPVVKTSLPASGLTPPPHPERVVPILPCANVDEISVSQASAVSAHGYEPHPRLVSTVRMLVGGLVFVAVFGAGPALYDLFDHLRSVDSPSVATWAYAVLLVTALQFGYAVYLWQLPDWSSVWVVTVVMLVLSVAYAVVLGATYVSADDGKFVQLLQLSDKLRGGQATGWCFIMLCLTSLISYLSGRISVRWYQAAI